MAFEYLYQLLGMPLVFWGRRGWSHDLIEREREPLDDQTGVSGVSQDVGLLRLCALGA